MATPNAINLIDIKQATAQDPMLTKLKDLILNHNWHTLPKNASDSITVDLKSYDKIKNSLTYNNHHEVILKDNRIVLPKVYLKIAITLAHHGYQGIMKTKALLRSKVFFFNMNKLVGEEIENCIACQSLTPLKPPPLIVSTKIPEKVWKAINMDYLEPLPNGKYCLVLIDQRSRYPNVAFKTSTNATSLIKSWRLFLHNMDYLTELQQTMDHSFRQQMFRIISKVSEYIIKK